MTTPLDNGRVSVREALEKAQDAMTETSRLLNLLYANTDKCHMYRKDIEVRDTLLHSALNSIAAALSTPPPDDGRARQLAFDIWDVWLNSSSIHPSTAAFAQKAAPIIAAALEEERERMADKAFEIALEHREKARKKITDGYILRPLDIENLAHAQRSALKGRESK